MKQLKEIIQEKLKISSKSKVNTQYHPKDKEELKELVDKLIKERGEEANLNDIDTSEIKDMSELFKASKFNGDISEWDVSNVTNMKRMFANSYFTGKNGSIENWNVNDTTEMFWIFWDCPLEDNPPKWYHKEPRLM